MSSPHETHWHPRTILIGSEPLLAAWDARASGATTVIPVLHTDLPRALDTIDERQPDVVVIEQTVASTQEGATLMARLHDERYERGLEVRLLPPDRAASLIESEPGELHPHEWLIGLAHPLPSRPTRNAARVRVLHDEEAFIDGHPVRLIDVSAAGAQVQSSIALKPKQRIRLVLPRPLGGVKTSAVVAWSAFEMGPTPRYRAGIAFAASIPNLAEDVAAATRRK